jgi:xylulokinase
VTRLLAVDVGTTATKAGVFDDGRLVGAVAERAHPLSHPRPGWAEQDADGWWHAVAGAVADLAAGGVAVDAVDALTVTGQMQDLVALDHDLLPTCSAILYADQRAAAQHAALAAELGDEWAAVTGAAPDATNLAAKWRWVQEHHHPALQAAHVVFGGHSAVVARATGAVVCDPTTATTTGLYGPTAGTWWQPLVERLGIPVPRLVAPTELVGRLTPGAAAELGLAAGTPVVHGPGDVVSTSVGIMGTDTGAAYAYLGTSGWVAVAVGAPDPRPGVVVLPGLSPTHWITVAPIITAAAAADWAREVLLGGCSVTDLDAMAEQRCAAAEGVVFVPHLDGSRMPVADPDATGVLVGVRRSTDRAVVGAAVMEGVAHAITHIRDVVAPDATELLLCGGAVRSAQWCRTVADVGGLPVVMAADEHASLLGAVAAAHVALGAPVPHPPAAVARVAPDPVRHAAHRRLAPTVRALLPTLAPTFAALAAARAPSPAP